jgi:hypothetical protein
MLLPQLFKYFEASPNSGLGFHQFSRQRECLRGQEIQTPSG